MTKVTLDMDTFKALASDTRLDILKTLDGKKMSLKDISTATNLNKATLHEHLAKLNEAGLVKRKEREGHKWVTYKLTWKGECLLHPENTKIVVMFATTFIALAAGIVQLVWFIKGKVVDLGYTVFNVGNDIGITTEEGARSFNEALDYAYDAGINITGLPEQLQAPIQSGGNRIGEIIANECVSSGQAPLSIPSPDQSLVFINTKWAGDGASSVSLNTGQLYVDKSEGVLQALYQNPLFLYIGIACFTIFTIVLCVSLWRYWENKKPKI